MAFFLHQTKESWATHLGKLIPQAIVLFHVEAPLFGTFVEVIQELSVFGSWVQVILEKKK